MSGQHWRAFDAAWFTRHHRGLTWLLACPLVGRWFRWVLRIRRCDVGSRGRIVALFPHAYVVANADGTYTADVRTHAKFGKRLYYAFRPLWWLIHAWDWAVADRWMPALSYGFATLTAYPDPHPETTTVDGYVARSGFTGPVDESWSAIRSGSGNESADSYATADEAPLVYTGSSSNTWRYMSRVICLFDTSGLASGYVSSATVSLYGKAKYDDAAITPALNVYSAAPASNTALVNADYGTFGTTAFASALSYSSVTTSGYNDLTLNGTGIAAVSTTGITKLGFRLVADASNAAPTWNGATSRSGFGFYLADETGTSKDPKLVVTYTTNDPFLIDGDPVEVRDKSLTIQQAANGRATLDAEVISLDGALRPALGSEVTVQHQGSVIFAGTIEHVTEAGLGGHGVAPIVSRVSAIDFNGLADRRLLSGSRSSETTTARLSWIAGELTDVTLHGSQATGVTLEAQTYDYVRAADALKDIALANGEDWIWRIDADKKLRVLASGTETAPFDIADAGYAVGDVVVERSRETYRNAITLRCGDSRLVTRTETFTATASQTSFVTAMPAAADIELSWPSVLIVNGASQGAVGWGYGYLPAGTAWYWDYATHTLARDGGYTMAAGDVVTITYAAQYPFTVTAEDAGEIALYGQADELIERPDLLDLDAAQAMADAELAKRLLSATTVRYETREPGLAVGQVQHVDLPDRDLDTDVVITSITTTNDVGPTRLRYRVQADSGQFTDTYQATYQKWSQ